MLDKKVDAMWLSLKISELLTDKAMQYSKLAKENTANTELFHEYFDKSTAMLEAEKIARAVYEELRFGIKQPV